MEAGTGQRQASVLSNRKVKETSMGRKLSKWLKRRRLGNSNAQQSQAAPGSNEEANAGRRKGWGRILSKAFCLGSQTDEEAPRKAREMQQPRVINLTARVAGASQTAAPTFLPVEDATMTAVFEERTRSAMEAVDLGCDTACELATRPTDCQDRSTAADTVAANTLMEPKEETAKGQLEVGLPRISTRTHKATDSAFDMDHCPAAEEGRCSSRATSFIGLAAPCFTTDFSCMLSLDQLGAGSACPPTTSASGEPASVLCTSGPSYQPATASKAASGYRRHWVGPRPSLGILRLAEQFLLFWVMVLVRCPFYSGHLAKLEDGFWPYAVVIGYLFMNVMAICWAVGTLHALVGSVFGSARLLWWLVAGSGRYARSVHGNLMSALK